MNAAPSSLQHALLKDSRSETCCRRATSPDTRKLLKKADIGKLPHRNFYDTQNKFYEKLRGGHKARLIS